jgi:hypothetical protein
VILRSRVKEVENYWASACDEDRHLIELYLPFFRRDAVQNPPPDSLQQCQWKNKIRNRRHDVQNIILHMIGHVRTIHFTEVVKSACGFEPREVENLKACAGSIRASYRSLQRLYAIEAVSSIAAQNKISANGID